MKVTIVSDHNIVEFGQKINDSLRLVAKDNAINEINKENTDILFLPDFKANAKLIKQIQAQHKDLPIVFNAVGKTMEQLQKKGIDSQYLIGMNLLPTFIDRPLAEVTLSKNTKADLKTLEALGWQVKQVESRVGLVTPRVICMIINEAYYTVQEGTANKADIDTGMKLGTNYPYGPFEWSNLIGLSNVYSTLKAMYEDTKEGRYKICPLLKKEAGEG